MKRSVLLLGLLMAGLTSGVMATTQPLLNSPMVMSSLMMPTTLSSTQLYHVTFKVNGTVKAEGEVRTTMGKEAHFDATQQKPYVSSVSTTHTLVLPSNVDKNEKISDEKLYNQYAQKVLAINDGVQPGLTTDTHLDPSVVTTGLIVSLTPQAQDHVKINLNYSELLSIRTFTAEDGASIELPDVFQQTNEQNLTLAPEQSMVYTLDVGHCKGNGGGTLTGDAWSNAPMIAMYACHPNSNAGNFFGKTADKRVTIEIKRLDDAHATENSAEIHATSLKAFPWTIQQAKAQILNKTSFLMP